MDLMYLILSCQIIIYFVCRYAWYSSNIYINFCDFRLRYNEETYILSGIDPIDAINGVNGLVPLKNMEEGGNLPWVYIYNMVLCLPWLQQDTALLIYRIIQILIVIQLNALQIRELVSIYNIKKSEQIFMMLQMLGSMCVIFCLQTGNTGFMIPQLILYQILTFNKSSKHEWIQIGLMCISLNKPQIAALYCLLMLIYRPFKTIICGQIFVGIPWLTASLVIKKDPIQLALNFWKQTGKTYNVGVVTGWLNPWIAEGYLDRQTGQLITMTLTVLVIAVIQILNKKKTTQGEITETEAIFKQATLISILTLGWMYVNKMDYYIAFIAVVLAVAVDRMHDKNSIKTVDILLASAINILCIQRADVVRMSTGNLGIRLYQNLLIMILWVIWYAQINMQNKHIRLIKTVLRFLIALAAVIQVIQVYILGIVLV